MKRTRRLVAFLMSALVMGGIVQSVDYNITTASAAVENRSVNNNYINESYYK